MKKTVAAAAAVLSMAVVGSSAAETVSQIERHTREVIRKRLDFVGHTEVKITSVRCQTNGYEGWYCIVWENSFLTGRFELQYVVSVSGHNLHWVLQN